MIRCLCLALVAQLALGCSTLRAVDPAELRQQLRASREPIGLRAQDGSTVRLDPNTEVRFQLRDGSVTRWVRGGDLWHSQLGLSFGEEKGVFLLRWEEIGVAEVRNLSSGKTAAAIAVSAVIVGVVVIAILGSLKGGGGGGGGGSIGHIGGLGGSSGRSRKGLKVRPAPISRRRLHRRGSGGVHVHVPLVVLAAGHHHGAHHHGAHRHVHPGPPTEDRYASLPPPPGSGAAPGDIPPEEDPSVPLAATAVPSERQPTEIHAAPLFDPGVRRRFKIQLMASAAAGTEFVRFDRYSGSLYVGMRVRDAFELGGGVRHMLAPLPPSGGETLESSVVGFGRIGAHLGLGVSKRAAIAMSLDAGSGHNSLLQLTFNIGLRVKATEKLSIGLFPFTPTFNYYKEDSAFRGALRWTFPTTLEIAFNY